MFPVTRERETDMILDELLGNGDDSEVEGMSEDDDTGQNRSASESPNRKRYLLNILLNDWEEMSEVNEMYSMDEVGVAELGIDSVIERGGVSEFQLDDTGIHMAGIDDDGVREAGVKEFEIQETDMNVAGVNDVEMYEVDLKEAGVDNVVVQETVANISGMGEAERDIELELVRNDPTKEIDRHSCKTNSSTKQKVGLKSVNKIKKHTQKRHKRANKEKKKTVPKPNWKVGKFQKNIPSIDIRPQDLSEAQNDNKTPLIYFKAYYSDDFFSKAAEYTNMYYLSKYGKVLNTSAAEIKKLYGMHLLMGCIKFPRMRMYWSAGFGLEIIKKAMPRDRFIILRNSLHVVDINNPPPNRNRLWKIQPVLDAVKNGCDKIERQPGNYSVDEQMIPFLGRCNLRQYVPNKPRPVGLKNFVLTTSDGIMLDFEVYQGKQSNFPAAKVMGLGPSVVMRLKESVPPLSVIYFDRFFTTIRLMEALASEQYFATGTLMGNRLQEIDFIPLKNRGEFEERVSPNGKVVAVKWQDNQAVTLLSTVCGGDPVTEVKRWSKKEAKFVNIECPAIVVSYNKNMGGVDTLNQLIEVYRTWFKTRKWTLKVVLHFLDVVVVNCWLQYRRDAKLKKLKKRKQWNFCNLGYS